MNGEPPRESWNLTEAALDRDIEIGLLIADRLAFTTVVERGMVVEKYSAVDGGNQTLDRLADYLASS